VLGNVIVIVMTFVKKFVIECCDTQFMKFSTSCVI